MEVHGRTDGRTDRRTDVQADSYIPPPKLRLRGYNNSYISYIFKNAKQTEMIL